jgi:transmembrane sensor
MEKLPENINPEMIVAYLKNQISDEDLSIVQGWIDASSENQRHFEQFKVVWEETGKLIPAPVDVDIDSAWNKISFKIDEFEEKTHLSDTKSRNIIPFRKYLLRVAAVLLPLIAITTIYLLLNQKSQIVTKETTAQALRDTLSDGSVVSLNKNSKISYPQKFKGNKREVEMEGEIFFEVKPNKEKPFIIHAENTTIKVLGTSFNVIAFANSANIEVHVKTGRVMFYGKGKEQMQTDSVTLLAGDIGIYNKSTLIIRKVDLPGKVELQQGEKILIFNRTSLLQVTKAIQKNYGVTIILKNKALENLHYTATFKNSSLDSIIQVMVNTLDLKATKKGTDYILDLNEQ